jgi:diguanylate cyclase (GGDEF)-like protein
LLLFDGKKARLVSLTHRLEREAIYTLLETLPSQGAAALWLGTRNSGLLRVVESEWQPILPDVTTPDASVTSLLLREDLEDPELWLGTHGFGSYRFRQDRWQTLRVFPDDAASNTVLSLVETRAVGVGRRVWAGTRHGGVWEWDGVRWRAHTEADGSLPSNHVQALLETFDSQGNGLLWVGTRAGVAYFDGLRWHRLEFHRSSVTALSATGTAAQEIWLGTSTGLFELRDNRIVRSWSFADGLPSAAIHALGLLETSRGRELWIGTDGGGVLVLFPDATDGLLWGLEALGWPELPNLAVQAILPHPSGGVYVATDGGVGFFQETREAQVKQLSWMTFEHGLPSSQAHRGAMVLDGKGRVWIGTASGGAVFDPRRGFQRPPPLPLFLEAANFSPQGERVPLTSGQPAAFRDGIVLLNFRLGSLFGESLNRYRSELVGLDPGPTPWTRSSQREVGPLPPGEYLFRVWAEDAWGGVSGPAVLRWTVAPHFWESLPAKLGLGLLLGLLVFVGVRVRHAQLRKRQVELKEAVQRLTEALHRENQRLSDLSYLDPLTGIPNRRRFEERLEEEWRRGERSQLPLSLVILDIESFKRFNDSHGHLAGDEALIRVAAALKLEVSRVSDVVARLGGEEFVILLPGTSLDGAERVAERVLLRVRQLGIERQDQPNPG